MAVKALDIKKREGAGKAAARDVRVEGDVPAIIYGGGSDPISVSVNKRELLITYNKGHFKSRPIELKLGKDTIRALPRDVQLHPVSDEPLHIDFLRLAKGKKVKVWIPVTFSNHEEAPGLKRGGILSIVRRKVECWCDGGDIPLELKADLAGMVIGESVHISDITLPDGVKPTIERDFTIAAIAGRKLQEAVETDEAELDADADEADTDAEEKSED